LTQPIAHTIGKLTHTCTQETYTSININKENNKGNKVDSTVGYKLMQELPNTMERLNCLLESFPT
jgi:hypothetical protein